MTYDLAKLTAAETFDDGPISRAKLLACHEDPAKAVLAVYRARARAYRCMAQTVIRDLKRDPGNGILHRRLIDYRDRCRLHCRFYWVQRRRLDYMNTVADIKARAARRRVA